MSPDDGVKRLSSEQKTGFVLLLLFGVLTIGLGFLQMRNNIYSPFLIQRIAAQQDAVPVHSFFDDQTRLQQIDTDQDGLNDYEELNFYLTSPYLPDTDSDHIEDKVEIEQGTDPLCPEGEECGDTGTVNLTQSVTSTGLRPLADSVSTPADLFSQALLQSGAGQLSQFPEDANIDTLTQDPEFVRQLLLSTGSISQEQLEAFSDEQLMALTQQLVTQYQEQQQ